MAKAVGCLLVGISYIEDLWRCKMAKIYPNDNCPCKSGKKYKHCCGKKQQADKIDIESIPRSNLKLEII